MRRLEELEEAAATSPPPPPCHRKAGHLPGQLRDVLTERWKLNKALKRSYQVNVMDGCDLIYGISLTFNYQASH